MSTRLNLPILPDPDVVQNLVDVLRLITKHAEDSIPLYNQAKSLSHERGIMLDKLFDVLIDNAPMLADAGALQPIQDVISDMLSNEIENMETLAAISANNIALTASVRETVHEFGKQT